MDLTEKLSFYFTLGEMIRTSHHTIDNTPTPEIIEKLQLLCRECLHDVRFRFGPLHVTSGYRCRELNAAVGGEADSAHIFGCAADFIPYDNDNDAKLGEIMRWVIASKLPFDQVIWEHTPSARWIHIGMVRPGFEMEPRRQSLVYRCGSYSTFK
jgi:zinc D-Ala-D-Ala carboxypeptidase